MKTKHKKFIFLIFMLFTVSVFYACQKETSLSSNGNDIVPAGQAKLSVYLTDGPYDYQKVLVDIQSIDVKTDTCQHFGDADDDEHHNGEHDSTSTCDTWTTLQIQPGIYDLLQLRNGVDTLLGASLLPQGKIKQVRITLGDNNSIMADSIVSPLRIWGDKNYVTIKIKNEHLDPVAVNNFLLMLDFNIAKSIRFDNGTYWLKPALRPFCRKNTGEIEGKIRPDSAFGMITAFNGTDTAYALPDHHREGAFKIRGLNEGNYTVLIAGKNGYLDSTISEVKVQRGKETQLGKIVLHQ